MSDNNTRQSAFRVFLLNVVKTFNVVSVRYILSRNTAKVSFAYRSSRVDKINYQSDIPVTSLD